VPKKYFARVAVQGSRRSNAVKQVRIRSCIDVDLHCGVFGRKFKNIFPRRGDEAARAVVPGSVRMPCIKLYPFKAAIAAKQELVSVRAASIRSLA
jgi:hypothetical protein